MQESRFPHISWLPRPYQLAGSRGEVAAVALCCIGLIAVFLADVLTPVDVLLSSLALFPILYADWTLSGRGAILVCGLAAAVLILEVLLGSANGVTVGAELVVYIGLAVLTRTYARHMAVSPPSEQPARGNRLELLTRREREVVVLAARGRTAPEIADLLHIGERTVETHLANAYPKLGVRSKLELVKQAVALGV